MSIYEFIDTVEGVTGATGADKPTEALKINGQFIEDQITGYRTLYVKGRETLLAEAESYEVGLRDGTILQSRRFPERIITIGFQLICSTASAFRTAFNKLNTILNTEDAELIFNDELDKYYVGTPIEPDEVDPGSNAIVSEFSIVCNDPFKYSTTVTNVQTSTYSEQVTDEDGNTSTVTSQVLTTDNTGGYKTYPAFQVQFATDEDASHDIGTDADCGYVLFAKGGTDYSVQIGDDQEKDTTTVKVLNHKFAASSRGGFTDTNSIAPLRSVEVHNGSSKATAKGLMLNATTTVAKKYHGPFVVYTPSMSGYYATGEFTVSWKHILACASKTATGKKQGGCFWIYLLDSNNAVKMAYGLVKNGQTTFNAYEYVYDYVNGLWESTKFNVAYTGKAGYKKTADTTGRLSNCYFKRKLTYDDQNNLIDCRTTIHNCAGQERVIVEDTPCTIAKIAFFFGKYGSNPAFHSNRVTQVAFTNGAVDNINTFSSGDYAEVDCNSAEITLNNKSSDNLGDVGNDWEDMYLDVGTNTMYVQYSDWVTAGFEPTITMTYRKRWI